MSDRRRDDQSTPLEGTGSFRSAISRRDWRSRVGQCVSSRGGLEPRPMRRGGLLSTGARRPKVPGRARCAQNIAEGEVTARLTVLDDDGAELFSYFSRHARDDRQRYCAGFVHGGAVRLCRRRDLEFLLANAVTKSDGRTIPIRCYAVRVEPYAHFCIVPAPKHDLHDPRREISDRSLRDVQQRLVAEIEPDVGGVGREEGCKLPS